MQVQSVPTLLRSGEASPFFLFAVRKKDEHTIRLD